MKIMIFWKIQSPQIPSSLQPRDPSQAPPPPPSLSESRYFEKSHVIFQNPNQNKKKKNIGSSSTYIETCLLFFLFLSPLPFILLLFFLLFPDPFVQVYFQVHDQNQLSEFYYAADNVNKRKFLSKVLPCSEKVPGVFRFFSTSNRS